MLYVLMLIPLIAELLTRTKMFWKIWQNVRRGHKVVPVMYDKSSSDGAVHIYSAVQL